MSDHPQTGESELEEAPKPKPKDQNLLPWLRPATAAFSVIAGLMYLMAALAFYIALYAIGKSAVSTTDAQHAEQVERMVESGATEQNAIAVLEAQAYALDQLGALFPIEMAFLGCLSLLIIISGIGLLLKKAWSISLGRLSCIMMIVAIAAVLILNKEAAANIAEKSNQMMPSDDYHPLSWLTIIRYVFLCSMCPIALIIAYGVLVKQYASIERMGK